MERWGKVTTAEDCAQLHLLRAPSTASSPSSTPLEFSLHWHRSDSSARSYSSGFPGTLHGSCLFLVESTDAGCKGITEVLGLEVAQVLEPRKTASEADRFVTKALQLGEPPKVLNAALKSTKVDQVRGWGTAEALLF